MTYDLTSLELAGFQVFENLIHIPLRRLTFLFGPNSAGKSSVEDALQICSELLKNNSFDTFPHGRFERLRRHWRRKGNEITDYSETLRIHLSCLIQTDIRGVLIGTLSNDLDLVFASHKNHNNFKSHEIQLKYSFIMIDPNENVPIFDSPIIDRNIELLIDNEPIIKFEEEYTIGINFEHPILLGIKKNIELFTMAREFPTFFEFQESWLYLNIPFRIDGNKRVDASCYANLRENVQIQNIVLFEEAFTYFIEYFNCIFPTVFANTHITIPVVPASRKIPTPEDLTFLISSDSYPFLGESSPLSDFGIKSSGDPQYEKLAWSFASKLFPLRDVDGEIIHNPEDEQIVANHVNQMLSEYLFHEKGYQIEMDYRWVLEKFTSQDLTDGTLDKSNIDQFIGFVRLFLVDPLGRNYSFSEVGSGLGYVLPVLCGLSSDITLLQQPELHLHPALQSSLGDVFIDSTRNAKNQLVIETHSEHILLRILRRIKQTSQAKVPPELFIEPDEVSILYFDPSPNDETTVTQLRISSDGDFLDRWPRGFFAERDKDLFDDDE